MRNKTSKIWLFISWILIWSNSYSQVSTLDSQIDYQFIKEWLLLGPLSSNQQDKDIFSSIVGLQGIDPKEGDTIITAFKDTLVWKHYYSRQKIINLREVFGNYTSVSVYAFAKLISNSGGKYQLLLGSDDGIAIWVNGKQIFYNEVSRQLFLDEDIVEIDLKKGINNLLLKITQENGEWGFAIRSRPAIESDFVPRKYFISSEYLKNQFYLPNNIWKYHPGDLIEWAESDFDDSNWEYANPILSPIEKASINWEGVGWYRSHIVIDSALIGKPLALSTWQAGISEIYIDGKLVAQFGKDHEALIIIPKVIVFNAKESHVIAVKYSNGSARKFNELGFNAGFSLIFGKINQIAGEQFSYEKSLITYQIFFISFSLAIALLHLIFFGFSPKLKQNLYFSLFLLLYAAVIYFDYQQFLANDIGDQIFNLRTFTILWQIFLLLKLRFIYSLYNKNLPRQFWIVFFVALFIIIKLFVSPPQRFDFVDVVFMLTVFEIVRVIVTAIVAQKEGAWIIGFAYVLFLLFLSLDALINLGIIISFSGMRNPYAFGIISFAIAMSIYLSRDFARTNKKNVEQKIEQKLLEEENKRQSKELEEARQLQLSMLPKEAPIFPQIEISFFMKTATEVGGDYYDFMETENGSLTVVIGDATGHGMKSGVVVSATKSLFNALGNELEPLQFIKRSSEAIQAMHLSKMYMALTIAKIDGNEVRIAAAGMPFPLIYRSATGEVEEVELKGMPLGSFPNFPYKEEILNLNLGDVVLLSSDGYEELFNPHGALLGKERMKLAFRKIATESPKEIIGFLNKTGEEWRRSRNQEDDITFIAVKFK